MIDEAQMQKSVKGRFDKIISVFSKLEKFQPIVKNRKMLIRFANFDQ